MMIVSKEINILLVDDEPNVLKALSRLLNFFQLSTATSGDEALILAEQQKFDLVISDCRMMGMSGIEFLLQFKRIQPDAVRIMLTGYADTENTQQAVNQAEVFRFISKPWNNTELLEAVESGLKYQKMLLDNKKLAEQVRDQQTRQNERDNIISELETEEPGITKVNWGPDGAIIMEDYDVS